MEELRSLQPINEAIQQLFKCLITGYCNRYSKIIHGRRLDAKNIDKIIKVSSHEMDVGQDASDAILRMMVLLLLSIVIILLVPLGFHVREAQVIFLFLGTNVLLDGELRVNFGETQILHVGVCHGVLQGNSELELAADGFIDGIEEFIPVFLIRRNHAITSSSRINVRVNSSLQLFLELHFRDVS